MNSRNSSMLHSLTRVFAPFALCAMTLWSTGSMATGTQSTDGTPAAQVSATVQVQAANLLKLEEFFRRPEFSEAVL